MARISKGGMILRRLPAVRVALAPAEFDRAWPEGPQITLEQAVAYALAS